MSIKWRRSMKCRASLIGPKTLQRHCWPQLNMCCFPHPYTFMLFSVYMYLYILIIFIYIYLFYFHSEVLWRWGRDESCRPDGLEVYSQWLTHVSLAAHARYEVVFLLLNTTVGFGCCMGVWSSSIWREHYSSGNWRGTWKNKPMPPNSVSLTVRWTDGLVNLLGV